jgi:hypothetical protein
MINPCIIWLSQENMIGIVQNHLCRILLKSAPDVEKVEAVVDDDGTVWFEAVCQEPEEEEESEP